MALNPPIPDWRGRVVWLLGASSGIGAACAERLHAAGAQVVVSARRAVVLQAMAQRLPGLHALPCDAGDGESLRAAAADVVRAHGRIDLAAYCAGHYRAQDATQFDLAEMLRHLDINYTGALRWLDVLLPQLLAQGHGHLSLVASVAGYRGLPQALGYGPTKAALNNLADGLYLDLAPRGLGVSVVNPGFVDTPMTAQNRFRMPALVTPEEAARAMVAGWQAGAFEIHFPWRFTAVLKTLSHLGHGAYFRLVRRATGPA
jgi:NAD(P)-dependent dehydrogenase (short-subunit alcohol dehydrogenase family)